MPTKFISDFNECLLWLKKNKAGLASDTDTLRALLLVAIQDDQFELVQDSIVKEPTWGIDEILKDLWEQETSLHIKDSAHADMSIWSACRPNPLILGIISTHPILLLRVGKFPTFLIPGKLVLDPSYSRC